jgi:hypothetical protein
MKGRYAYYRCRSRYVGRAGSACPSKYIRTDGIEGAVRNSLLDVLADPARILTEARRLSEDTGTNSELATILTALQEIESKQRRLVRLFTDGDLPETLLESERTELSKRRAALESERSRLERSVTPNFDFRLLGQHLPRVTEQVRQWVLRAGSDDLSLMLRALDVQMIASPEQVQIRGAVPVMAGNFADDLATTERTSACTFNDSQIASVPFELSRCL